MPQPLAIVLPVRFHEAIAAATARQAVLPNAYYGELPLEARSQAFTVSGLAGASQIGAALQSLNEGLRKGMTFPEWKTFAADQDWSLSAARLDLIMRAHAQTAYNAGAWAQFDRVSDRRGYLMYSAINDSRTRPAHRAMDGIIRAVGDGFWDSHSPPCGYNCRCGLISLTEEQAANRGGVTNDISGDARADPGWGSKPSLFNPASLSALAGAAIDVPAPLQTAIMDWHDLVQNERIADRVQAFLGDGTYARYKEAVSDFLDENDGLLLEHEAIALRAYTGNSYVDMNRYLRGLSGTSLDMQATISSAVSGLSKLPAYEGQAFRGIYYEALRDPVAFLEAHLVGEVVEYQAFTSASYEDGGAFGGTVQYTIHSRTGRVVEGLSAAESEYEVIFPPGTKFRVSDVHTEDNILYITLDELDDQTTPVADNRKFSKKRAQHQIDAMLARSQSEVDHDPAALARFKAAHDGMTPIQLALSKFPSARMEIEQSLPWLLPKKK